MATPYLSIVYTGRNDNFGGDFNDRFFRAVRFNHERLSAAGVRYDIVFVEWRPVPGKPLLGSLLRTEVPEVDERLTTIEVDARYHDAFSQNPRIQFHEFIAKNVAIRRAAGSYILATNSDIYLSRDVVAVFARRVLRPMVLYRATRVDLKSHLDPSAIDDAVLLDARNHERVNTLKAPLFTNAAGDFLLLDRFSYHAIGGFNEVFRIAKIHIDANFCHRALASGLLLVDIGARVYHLGEGTFHAMRSVYGKYGVTAPWGQQWHKGVLYRNPLNWGLRDAPLERSGPRHFRLEFVDAAVPRLVELAGITRDEMERGQFSAS
jgi:hypothetical protein